LTSARTWRRLSDCSKNAEQDKTISQPPPAAAR
jgi:hypothetical protein